MNIFNEDIFFEEENNDKIHIDYEYNFNPNHIPNQKREIDINFEIKTEQKEVPKKKKRKIVEKKVKKACFNCKRRHRKCDEVRPCFNCKKAGLKCFETRKKLPHELDLPIHPPSNQPIKYQGNFRILPPTKYPPNQQPRSPNNCCGSPNGDMFSPPSGMEYTQRIKEPSVDRSHGDCCSIEDSDEFHITIPPIKQEFFGDPFSTPFHHPKELWVHNKEYTVDNSENVKIIDFNSHGKIPINNFGHLNLFSNSFVDDLLKSDIDNHNKKKEQFSINVVENPKTRPLDVGSFIEKYSFPFHEIPSFFFRFTSLRENKNFCAITLSESKLRFKDISPDLAKLLGYSEDDLPNENINLFANYTTQQMESFLRRLKEISKIGKRYFSLKVCFLHKSAASMVSFHIICALFSQNQQPSFILSFCKLPKVLECVPKELPDPIIQIID